MTLTKPAALALQRELLVTLTEFAKKHGMTFAPGRGRYDPASGEYRLSKATFKMLNAPPSSGESLALMQFGLKHSDLGRTLVTPSGTFTLVGVKPNRPKYPLQIKNVATGRMHKAPKHFLTYIQK
jgi:hypothetical protein